MTLDERGFATPSVKLADLLIGHQAAVSGETAATLRGYVDCIIASGFPGMMGLRDRIHRRQMDGYLRRTLDVDFTEVGHAVRRPAVLERWLAAYAAATAKTSSFETIRDAATAGHREKPAKTTTMPYRDVLERLWIVEPLPAGLGWES